MSILIEKRKSNKIPGRSQSLYLWTTGYDPIFVEKMKLFPLRFFDPVTKQWEIPLSSLSIAYKNFKDLQPQNDIEEIKEKQFETLEKYMEYLKKLEPEADFDFKTKPDPHQVEWFNEMLTRKGVILGDPMGLGKTKEFLDVCEYRRLNQGYRHVIIICKAKHKFNMGKEIETHTNSDYIIVDGTKEKRLQQLRDYYYKETFYLIIGYEAAGNHAKELINIGENAGIDAIVMDEFNKIKNYSTKKTREDGKAHLTVQITKLVETLNPDMLILASGTPITKDSMDLYAPLRMLGVTTKSAYQFQKQFCVLDYFGRPIGSKNQIELRDMLSTVMIRRPKELLGLKPKKVQYLPVRMGEDQARLYKAVKNQIREELEGTKALGAHQLALLTRLRQVTTDPSLIDSDVEGIKEYIFAEWLEEILAGGEKGVVFSIYKQETRRLKELYSSLNPAYIDGDTSSMAAMAQVERLQNDQETRLLIGSLHATKESYTMTAATRAFFFDLSWTVTDNEQAQDRIHRRGQLDPVHILIPYCVGSIDERVLAILDKDSKLISEVVDGASARLTKEVVDYLLQD